VAAPFGVVIDELPPAADDGAFGCAVRPPAAFGSRWQPASASARDAARIIRAFMVSSGKKDSESSASSAPL
jgi:hypothetical protein